MDAETHADRATPGVVKRLSFLVVAVLVAALVILAGAVGDGGAWSIYPTENIAICNAAGGDIVAGEALGMPPAQPTNLSPTDNATVSLNPTLQSSAFSDNDTEDTHLASQWQITATSENYTSPVFDSGTDNINLTQIAVPAGKLNDNTAYYWRVKHGDNHGAWSEWSLETSFTTLNHPPVQPTTISPLNGDNVTVTAALQCSAFSDPDSGDTHAASRWQMTSTAGDYSSTVVDDITARDSDLTTRTTIAGVLRPEITYYWRVRHQDNHGAWTEWSAEASFTTVNRPPDKPADLSPKSGALGVSMTPKLESPVSDPDGDPDHYASQWQITATVGDYTSTVWDDTSNASYVNVPEGILDAGITYYWRVRHQDKQEEWSEWSDEVSFTVRTAFPSAGGEGGLPFWAWLLIALGGVAVVAAVLIVVLRLRRAPQNASRPKRRRRQR